MKTLLTLTAILLTISSSAQTMFNAVIVGENVRMRSEANTKATIVKALNTGDVITYFEKSEERVIIPLNQGACDDFGYYWYKINTINNETGWVYGAFVFIIEQQNDDNATTFYISKKQLNFNTGKVDSYGAADENGLTGCDEYSFPFFYNKTQNKIYPIKLDLTSVTNSNTHLSNTKDKNWLLLYNGEGGSDNITDIKQIENALELTISRNFQEGGATAVLLLTFNGNYFDATVKSYETFPGY